jgi:hypothetical protein
MSASDLPNELIFEIIQYLSLKTLIATIGVNKRWRRLVPFANVLPARRALLDLYLNVICKPAFLRSRSRILPHLVPFDRQAYVSMVTALNGDEPLPDLFELWLLEWPAKDTICWHWPGISLPNPSPFPLVTSYLHRNCLDFHHTSVQIVEISEMVRPQVKSYVNVFVRVVDLNPWTWPEQMIILGGELKGRICFRPGLSSTMTWQQHMLETLETLGRRFG